VADFHHAADFLLHSGNYPFIAPLPWYTRVVVEGYGMSKDEYRRNATECMHLAIQMEDPKDRLQLLLMAQAWLKLADYTFAFEDTALIARAASKPEAPKEE
jgi:hypothetical protein